MKILFLSFLLAISLTTLSFAQNSEKENLIKLDLGWEKALLDSDVEFLENLLSDDFIWVHNHAGLIDGKPQVVASAKRIQSGQAITTKSRTSRDHQVVILENTAIVTGYTLVDRAPSPTLYNFMRTYVKTNSGYRLLGNHTMAIPEEEIK
ncbi:uncharacterized protein DUF4440 [Algoriphagus boseongensis]|uniref:Uncharacterized protein DUF4440 n=1 Tax=Algoriphagus boseongensis TaxID=1442587 RepID=A0A4R6T407_9BACT|nr:nuclear transport factor 2 family protein [Algoriphagus boseongensis]TDQ15055.1 uncharacterized protein DUF4440 [Algoriphagus boseongensis]